MNAKQYKQQGGFTLLELVVVVAVLGLIANLATEFVAQNTNQERFNTTKARQAMIREAILGNPSATQNGDVQLSGYVMDTGEVPRDLRQLLSGEDYCTKPENDNKAACEADPSSPIWVDTPDSWNGPYLHGHELETKTLDGNKFTYNTFRDGWGNSEDSTEDKLNFGWNYDTDQNNDGTDDEITLISKGLDGVEDPTTENEYDKQNVYEQDYPRKNYDTSEYTALILSNELTALSYFPISITIENTDTSNPSSNLCLRVWRANDASNMVDIYKPSAENSFTVPTATTVTKNIDPEGINIHDDRDRLIASAQGVYYIDVVEVSDCNAIATAAASTCQETLQPIVITRKVSSISLSCTLQ